MSLIFRLILVLFGARRRPPLRPLDLSSISFRVLPNDLDLNLHMNNGRYLTLMDLGRIDLMARAGLVQLMRRYKWMPLVGAEIITFRRPLKLWQKYELSTQLLGWDGRWFYIRQIFTSNDKEIATAYVRAMLRGRDGTAAPNTVLSALGISARSPPLDDIERFWRPEEEVST